MSMKNIRNYVIDVYNHFWMVNLILLFAVCGVIFLSQAARAEGIRPKNILPSKEPQDQNCSEGSYSGPRLGRVRYTKDTFIWVTTPEFAKKFYMPEEFISSELKEAEAVVFKIIENFLNRTYAKLRWLGAKPQTVQMVRQGEATTPTSVLRKS
ncbi:MAG: hypothetical protein K2X63_01810 [Burkholderiaceae bacterium]|nr:hypothetical protein [Burkholderiaceae bacterium]